MAMQLRDNAPESPPFGKVRGPVAPIHKRKGVGGGIRPMPVQAVTDADQPAPDYNLKSFILPKSEQGGQSPVDSYGAGTGSVMGYGNDAAMRSNADAFNVDSYSPSSVRAQPINGGLEGVDTSYATGGGYQVSAGSGGKFGGPPAAVDVYGDGRDAYRRPGELDSIGGIVGGPNLGKDSANPDRMIQGPPLQAPPLTPGQLDDTHLANLLTGILGPTSGPPAATGDNVGGSPALVIPVTPEASGGSEPAPRPKMSKGVMLLLVVAAAVGVFLLWRHKQ